MTDWLVVRGPGAEVVCLECGWSRQDWRRRLLKVLLSKASLEARRRNYWI